MGLRRRITIAFLICIFLPVLMFALAGTLILQYQRYSVAAVYDVDADMVSFLQNSPVLFGSLTNEAYREIQKLAESEPQKLTDEEWLEKTNESLSERYSFVLVRKGEHVIYCGNRAFADKILHALPEYGENKSTEGGTYLTGANPAMIRQVDFLTNGNEPATVFLITDVDNWLPQWRDTAVQVIIAVVVCLNLTAAVIVVWLYRSIVRPLAVLRAATNQIKEGNLDCSIHGDEHDEIGQLQNDFEDMRTHLKEMSDQQLRSEQESREMMSNISHDLKTPLTAIKGYSEGLMDGVADTPEKRERYVRTIYAKACDMERLVDELAFFAKIDQAAVTYDFRKVAVWEYLSDCVGELRLDMEVKGIFLDFTCDCDASVKAIFDPEQIKRVISNIIGNSVKYMDKQNGKIAMHVSADSDMVWVSIEDNGSGIREQELPHIFTRFYRGDSSRGTKKGGSGLGLAIVKSIVTDHGGSVVAESVYGEGTRIRFSLQRHSEGVVAREGAKEQEEKKLWIKS